VGVTLNGVETNDLLPHEPRGELRLMRLKVDVRSPMQTFTEPRWNMY